MPVNASVEEGQHTTRPQPEPAPTKPAAERTRDAVQYEAGKTERVRDWIEADGVKDSAA